MNKNLLLNIFKIVLGINVIICLLLTAYDEYQILLSTMLLPLGAFYMNKYKRKITRNVFIFHVIRKVLTFFSIVWIGILFYNPIKLIFTYEFIDSFSHSCCYFSILLNIFIIIDILIDKRKYNNNLIFILYLVSFIVLGRILGEYHLPQAEWELNYYNNNIIIILILTILTWINGYIELNRLKIKLNK